MMRLRKSLGLLLTFSMAHLAMVTGNPACEKPESKAAQPADMANMHHAVPADHGSAPQKEPCDAPASGKCCEAVTSCAVAITLPSAMRLQEMPRVASFVAASIDEIPLSRVVAPDPPPPKV
jgi:hypothetical protein